VHDLVLMLMLDYYNYSIRKMKISFNYCLPPPEYHRDHHYGAFATPIKVKTLYGSRETAESAADELPLHPHRVHSLPPSHSPISSRKGTANNHQSTCPITSGKPRIIFTYLLDFSHQNI
jgi:hypothetical protein